MPEDSAAIFISYRRDESAGYARRIAEELIENFGEKSVVRDITWSDTGLGSAEAIERAVGSCEYLVAVIGKNWLTAQDAAGRKRLENPDDYVRREIATALQGNTRVIPLLVQGALMPSTDELPDDLASLASRNAFLLRDNSWDEDVRRLITFLDRTLERGALEDAPARDTATEKVVWLPAGVRRLVDKLRGNQSE